MTEALYEKCQAALHLVSVMLEKFPTSAIGSLIAASVGAIVSTAIFVITRRQARRETTLELFKEYYSADFALLRRGAERFMHRYRMVDWATVDPYDIGREDKDLAGYGAVLRYWQRVALLFKEKQLDKALIQRLLARELALWHVLVFKPVFVRKNIYVGTIIKPFVQKVSTGPAKKVFKSGEDDGNSMLRKSASRAVETSSKKRLRNSAVSLALCVATLLLWFRTRGKSAD